MDRDNHIVECVLAGTPELINPIAKKNFLRDSVNLEDPRPDGTLVPFEQIPEPCAGVLFSSRQYPESAENLAAELVFSPERRAEIEEEAATATKDEIMAYQLAWIDEIVANPGLIDYDVCPGWFEVGVSHSDGRKVCAIVFLSGYAFSSIRVRVAGFFPDSAAAKTWLESKGIPVPAN
jgi:hypothetical protein